MNPYLDRLRALNVEKHAPSPTDKTDKTGHVGGSVGFVGPLSSLFFKIQECCPSFVEVSRWQQAVEDGRQFLAVWGKQAEALGWTSVDLFALHEPPADPAPSYSRLSRVDEIGLVWTLRGDQVVALTTNEAVIRTSSDARLVYRRKEERR